MERLSTQEITQPVPVNRLLSYPVGDQSYYLLFPQSVSLPAELWLQRVEIDTKLIQVFEVYAAGQVQIGWCFKATSRKVVCDPHSLMVSTTAFGNYTLKDVLNSKQPFVLKYQMLEWQYLTYNGLCSVIIIPPTEATRERLE
jgi:hypothetical protein